MAISAVITLIALVLLVGIAVFAVPASIRHQRQTDDGRFTKPVHRFDGYDEHPSAGRSRKGSAGSAASDASYSFGGFDGGSSSSDCSSSGGDGGGGCS